MRFTEERSGERTSRTDPLPYDPEGRPRVGWAGRLPMLLAAALLLAPAAARGQADSVTAARDTTPAAAAPADTAAGGSLRVFLDCSGWLCDFDYLRRQVPYVNWVRQRQVADVHLLVTQEGTGAGGERITLDFLGRNRFEGEETRLELDVSPTATEAETRTRLTRQIELGLARFVARTDAAERIRIEYEGPAEQVTRAPEEDPWNYWVFDTDVGGSVSGEESQTSISVNGGISANRTTEEWKLDLGFRGYYRETEFRFEDEDPILSIRRSWSVDGILVNSLGPHWSAGGQAGVSHSSRRNQDVMLRVGPALEYNLFPYAESSRRQLSFLYTVGVNAVSYALETVYFQTSETLVDQTLTVSLDFEEPWGEAGFRLEAASYLQDLSQNHVSLGGRLELQLFRGFSLDVGGSVSRIRDQRYLPAEGASEEDVLLQRRELETGYEYFTSIGFSYTFGSIFNNVVNPRFDALDGGGFRF